MVLSGDGWTRESVFECGRCHQGVRQSGGSCVLILASFWLDLARFRGCRGSFSCLSFSSWDETARLICGGAIPHNKYRSSTLVGLRHPEMALQAAFRTGSIFEACDDLLQTIGHVYYCMCVYVNLNMYVLYHYIWWFPCQQHFPCLDGGLRSIIIILTNHVKYL